MADDSVRGKALFTGESKRAIRAPIMGIKMLKIVFYIAKNRDGITSPNLVPIPTILVILAGSATVSPLKGGYEDR